MSIAVSAVVKPSGVLFAMVGGMAVGAILLAVLIAAGAVGDSAFAPRVVAATVCILIVLQGFCRFALNRIPRRIEISGGGQIRLAKQYSSAHSADSGIVKSSGELLQLTRNSICWPGMLLLLLQTEGGQTYILPVLRDSVAPDDFRAMSVACRWIVARSHSVQSTNL